MRRLYKIIIWTTGIVLLLTLFVGLLTYWKVSTEWKEFYSDDEMKSLAKDISNSREMSDTFYGIHDKLNNDRHKSIETIYLNGILNDILLDKKSGETSWHVAAANFLTQYDKDVGRFHALKLAFGLSHFVTSEKCFDYVMMKNHELMSNVGHNFEQPNVMTDTVQILKFIITQDALTRYKDQELLNKRVGELKMKLK
jgi:hypothetical protein